MSRPRRTAKAVPDGYDQVARLEQMRAAHPYVHWHHRTFWYGAHPVGRWTWRTGSRNDLRDVLDALDKLIALDHTLTATEEARPGPAGRSTCPRCGPGTPDAASSS